MNKSRIGQLVLFSLFGIYCFIYPSSLFLLITGTVPDGTEWMASLMLVLVGLIATLWVMLNYGLVRGFSAAFAMLSGGFVVEAVGVSTGFPFGQYEYTDVLSPKLLVVPIGITFAWLMMVLSSFFTARFIVERLWPQRGLRTVILLSTSLALLSDLLMEPVATHIQGYWTWYDQGSYYGVPTQNFIAWAVTSVVLILVLVAITGQHKKSQSPVRLRFNFVPMALYMMNLIMFASINLSYSYYLAGVIGITVGVSCAYLISRARKTDLAYLSAASSL